ncbi:hypothetical protein MASR2M66_28510 [Chloroflexota bacterium]
MKFHILIIPLFLLAACTPANDTGVSYPNVSYPNVSYPNEGSTPNVYAPQPGDDLLQNGPVYIDKSEVLTLESSPLQFKLHIMGNLPTPCNALRVSVNPPNADHKIMVDAYSMSDPNKMCTQVLQPFDVNIPLGSFPKGTYTLWINGEQIAEFQA